MVLQRVIFPSKNKPEKLYFRKKGEIISFDTFFNAFSVEKWTKYTNLKKVTLEIICKNNENNLKVKFYNKKLVNNKIENIEIHTLIIEINKYHINFHEEINKGIIFFDLEEKDMKNIQEIKYLMEETEDIKKNRVKLSIVMCTYKREEYVQKFLDSFPRILKEKKVKESLEAYIIDNAGTLGIKDLENIKILKNKNYGGAGGFTRGIIEAVKGGATNILLMDDDIEIEESILERLIGFLTLLKDEYREYFIGGSMLIKENPSIQHEKFGVWKKFRNISIGSNRDLTDEKEILINENEERIALKYAAWWFCCFSVNNVKKRGLPSPFFIKGDDIEYSLRNKSKIINLNGLAVWHEDFSGKYSPYLYYYTVRNNIMTNFLTDEMRYSRLDFWINIILRCGNNIIRGRKIEVSMMKKGLQDVIKGLDFFEEIEPDKYHQEIMKLSKEQKNFFKDNIEVLKLALYISKNFETVKNKNRDKKSYYHSFEFWEKYLDIGGEKRHDTAL